MDKKIIIFIVLALTLHLVTSQIQLISLPSVSKATQNKLNLQINLLRLVLPTYNWRGCNKKLLYDIVLATSKILHTATDQMKIGNGNYLSGNGIIVGGQGNIVIGNNDLIIGSNNWCFTSGYSTDINQIDEGILAVSNFKITLSLIDTILKDPKQAISLLNGEQFQMLRSKNAKMSYFFS